MAPVFSIPVVPSSCFTDSEQKIVNACKESISSGTCLDCSSFGSKPFEHSDFDKRKLIVEQLAQFYNCKVLDGTLNASHLIRGHKELEKIFRWKCSNSKKGCNAAIWINKKGQLSDTTHLHKECCLGDTDANNSTLQMNGFITSNRDAYERGVYHLQCIKNIIKQVSKDNLYVYFCSYMRDIESLSVKQTWRKSLSNKLWYDVDKIIHSGVKRVDQTKALVDYLEINSEHYIKYEGRDDDGNMTHISWIDKRFDHFKSREKKIVFAKDVTFGVIDCNSGFDKLSTISALNADHTVDPLCFTVMVKETKECFTEEMEFFCQHYSWLGLKDSRSTWFVDGDKKSIIALETVLPLAAVTLCLYHLSGITTLLNTLYFTFIQRISNVYSKQLTSTL
jgi:hypothetical protein